MSSPFSILVSLLALPECGFGLLAFSDLFLRRFVQTRVPDGDSRGSAQGLQPLGIVIGGCVSREG